MSCGYWNTSITQGETWRRQVLWTDQEGTAVPLTGATATMSVGSQSVSTTVGPEDGTLHLVLTDTQTSALSAGNYDYHLWVVTSDGTHTPLLCGTILVVA